MIETKDCGCIWDDVGQFAVRVRVCPEHRAQGEHVWTDSRDWG